MEGLVLGGPLLLLLPKNLLLGSELVFHKGRAFFVDLLLEIL